VIASILQYTVIGICFILIAGFGCICILGSAWPDLGHNCLTFYNFRSSTVLYAALRCSWLNGFHCTSSTWSRELQCLVLVSSQTKFPKSWSRLRYGLWASSQSWLKRSCARHWLYARPGYSWMGDFLCQHLSIWPTSQIFSAVLGLTKWVSAVGQWWM